MLDEDFLIEQFKKHNVVSEGHFLLTSGRHSDVYVNKDVIYAIPSLFSFVVYSFFNILTNSGHEYDVVTGPAIAGAILAAPIAINLDKIFVYPEKAFVSRFVGFPHNKVVKTKIMEFNRGYDKVVKDKRVFIVEDVITTGGSVQRTIDAVKLCGGKCVGVLAIWNREGWTPNGFELVSLINKSTESWTAGTCLLCRNHIPLVNPKTGVCVKN